MNQQVYQASFERPQSFSDKATADWQRPPPDFVQTTAPVFSLRDMAKRNWSTGLFDCCNEFNECFLALCFPLCYQCLVFARADESFCSCLFGGVVPLRTKIRIQRGIKGSICEDFCCLMCCHYCSIIQMNKELKLTEQLI